MTFIDPKMHESQKLAEARKEFEACVSHYYDHVSEARRAGRFYHNSGGEGQWDADDLEYLKKLRRPALTFNLIKPAVDAFIGMYQDAKRKPMATPVGGEDEFLADVLGAIADRLQSSLCIDEIDAEVLLNGAVKGAYNGSLSVSKDPDDPTQIKVSVDGINCYEVHWDPTSETGDRKDAGYVIWSRWLSKSEFVREFPDYEREFEELSYQGDTYGPQGGENVGETTDFFGFGGEQSDYNRDHYYWDRRRNKIRVIHMEYKTPVKRYYATGPQGMVKVPEGLRSRFEQAGVPLMSVWADETHWLEFIGNKVLYDSASPEPFDGFSLVPFTFYLDNEENVPYGMVRNLFDPQQEVNKSYSQSVDHITAQARPGVLAEENAIPDIEAFEEERRTPGGTAIVAQGALTTGAVQEQKVPEFSMAAQKRLENSSIMVDKITGISADADTPAAQAEAAATVQIRYRKSYLKMMGAIRSFERYQRAMYEKLLQIITRAMPDHQIQRILGNDEKYRVQDGMVIEMDPKTGQPKRTAPIRAMRSLKYDIELETTSENTVQRLMEAQVLLELSAAQIPIPPQLVVRKALASRADREMAERYAEQMVEAQRQSAEMQDQVMQSQVAATLQLEAQKNQEDQRHNVVDELLQAEKQRQEHEAKLWTIWEKADTAEKNALVEVLTALEQAQVQREAAANRGNRAA